MYGIFTYISYAIQPNVGKYTLLPWMVSVVEGLPCHTTLKESMLFIQCGDLWISTNHQQYDQYLHFLKVVGKKHIIYPNSGLLVIHIDSPW